MNEVNGFEHLVKYHYQAYTLCVCIMRMRFVMKTGFNTQAPKKATNLSLNSELLAEAKRLNINLSATLEKALIEEVNERKRVEWLRENASAIQTCNELTENHGFFSDSFRVF